MAESTREEVGSLLCCFLSFLFLSSFDFLLFSGFDFLTGSVKATWTRCLGENCSRCVRVRK